MADALKVQLGIRQNAEELQDFLLDLNSWEDEVKKKDEELRISKVVNKQSLPPVRNQVRKKKKRKKAAEDPKIDKSKEGARISSYDYQSWDKFDVDKVLQEMDMKEEMETFSSSEEESEETDEDIEHERRLQRALLERDKGNTLFKEGKYEEAINCYTTGIQLDPVNAILLANRAMCLLKLQRYGAAEADCCQSLAIDGSYTKAFLRRAAAQFHLGKLQEARADYQEVLKLEPGNRQAQGELQKINKLLDENTVIQSEENKSKEDGSKKATVSKKPLRRIEIEEIGTDSESENEEPRQVTTRGCVTTSMLTDDKRRDTEQVKLVESVSDDTKPNTDATCGVCGKEDMASTMKPLLAAKSQSPSSTATTANSQSPPRTTAAKSQSPSTTGQETRTQSPPITTTYKSQSPSITSAATESQPSLRQFSAPKSSAQFHSDWRMLQKHPETLFQYFQKINPESYPKLFQQSIESDVLLKIMHILHDFYIVNGLSVYKELKSLSLVKRFSMTVMFLSDSDKKVIQELFTYTRKNQEALNLTENDILSLAKEYGVS